MTASVISCAISATLGLTLAGGKPGIVFTGGITPPP
jgi:hypothetical protein